ncbi:pseudaminic acid synthase [Campylobacter sp. RM9344]|uniref:Pseudaminic acid synthase n=1 Tax=Campylobacter californiensis TaxID=1032243 RepID=A0AAW3ZTL2_9BACT|nr:MULTISPECIES: pseudaminic acid synthase [unclassified Campylobacter]MBE2984073.1 pseudaminic acid synthase [Campylobacter sp. RM6883]MBE2995498.1 pseudaminic acid synthase [Campylobacter sp. RM6913]MBE3029842.1 pseudaminic acid synthase [Campylobacter sp. RM9344]MBE3607872.1 pseudaminic acid synthase [Campylobacter sp. RM9337]QCD51479.1 pseudaminic acid synthase [Campylobacter sp. RM6914]
MKIANFDTSKNVFIIAELSANHSGSLETAIKTIKAAKRAGANAIKLQTYTPDSLTLNSRKEDFMIRGGLWDGANLYELYQEALTPREWHAELFRVVHEEGLICFSSPFCKDDVDFLEQFNPPAYKIASFEANDPEFIRYVASKNKPMIISTGIITEDEIYAAVYACKVENNHDVALLKCTSSYPAPLNEMNLQTIAAMRNKFSAEVGFSDHTLGIVAPVVAVSLGARIIEKHFILDKSVRSVDEAFSLDEREFSEMVKAVRDAEALLGEAKFELNQKEIKNHKFARSLYASADIKKGEKFTEQNIRSVRPGYGLHPKFKADLIGKTAKRDIEFADKITKEDF